MAQDFLSQEEVDALLKGVTYDGEEAAEPAPETGGVRPYDLANQERIVRGRMPSLELINERFARNLRTGLFNYLQRNADVSPGSVRVQKYSDFIRNLVVPTSLNLIQLKPLRGAGLIVLDPNLVFLVVDNMFGGDGRFHTRVEGREFTPTESRIIQGLLKVVFAEYEKAWKPVFEIKCEYLRSELNCQFANIAMPNEVVIAVTFSLEFNASTVEMHFCIPYSMIEPIRELLSGGAMRSDHLIADKRWVGLLSRQIQDAELELVATLGRGRVSLRTILEMKAGDVIPIDIPEQLIAEADRVPVAVCRYGIQNGNYALKFERFISEHELATGKPKQ